MSDETLLRLVRHNTWANLELLEFCSRLSAEQLEWTTPGVYGTIHATLEHTVGAEHRYLQGLTGDEPAAGMITPGMRVPLGDLTERARSNGERMERALSTGFDPARRIARPSGTVAEARIIAAQYIHHGSDHRAQVGTILGANGVEAPSLDVWDYGRSIGEVTGPP